MALGPYQVIDPTSPWHEKVVYLEVEEGLLRGVEPVSERPRGYVIPGGVDLLAWTRWPDDPRAETLTALSARLQQAGYTEALVASPIGWSDPDVIATLLAEAQSAPISLHLLASFWAEDHIAPLESLRAAGAWGWTLPLLAPIPWKGLLEALSYLRYLGGPVFIVPFWEAIAEEDGVPQIPLLALSGWRGTPPMAETLAIRLLAESHRQTAGTLLIGPLTTRQGLKAAREESLTAFTALPYLLFSAERLLSYDPTWKVHPPLQEPADQKALWTAIRKGELLLIASYHERLPPEEKDHPWADAVPGIATLPEGPALFFSLVEQWGLSLTQAVVAWGIFPRQRLGLPLPELKVGTPLRHVLLEPLPSTHAQHAVAVRYTLRPLPATPSQNT
jgi:dihydroorotase